MDPSRIAEKVNDEYDDAVRDLSLDDAIAVAEDVKSYVEGALMGLREDKEKEGST